jgi:hypothetical protein
MLRHAFVPSFFALYQVFIAVIGMVGAIRILFEYPWLQCFKYGVGILAAFWIGQRIVSLFQNPRSPKTSLD